MKLNWCASNYGRFGVLVFNFEITGSCFWLVKTLLLGINVTILLTRCWDQSLISVNFGIKINKDKMIQKRKENGAQWKQSKGIKSYTLTSTITRELQNKISLHGDKFYFDVLFQIISCLTCKDFKAIQNYDMFLALIKQIGITFILQNEIKKIVWRYSMILRLPLPLFLCTVLLKLTAKVFLCLTLLSLYVHHTKLANYRNIHIFHNTFALSIVSSYFCLRDLGLSSKKIKCL